MNYREIKQHFRTDNSRYSKLVWRYMLAVERERPDYMDGVTKSNYLLIEILTYLATTGKLDLGEVTL